MGPEQAEKALKQLDDRVLRVTRPQDKRILLFYNDTTQTGIALDEGTHYAFRITLLWSSSRFQIFSYFQFHFLFHLRQFSTCVLGRPGPLLAVVGDRACYGQHQLREHRQLWDID